MLKKILTFLFCSLRCFVQYHHGLLYRGGGCCRILKYVLLKSLHDTVIRLLECLQLYFACTKCLERNFYQNGGKQLTFAWLKSGQNSNKNGNKSHFQNSVITLVFPPVFSRESLVENTNIYMYMYFNMFIICAKKRTRMFPSAGGLVLQESMGKYL